MTKKDKHPVYVLAIVVGFTRASHGKDEESTHATRPGHTDESSDRIDRP